MKFAPLKRVSVLGLAAASVWVVGCDDITASDKSVERNLSASEAELAKLDSLEVGKDPASADAALKSAEQAAAEASADPVWKATAAGLAGDLNAEVARRRHLSLISLDQAVRNDLARLRVLSQKIGLINSLNAGYNASNPSDDIARIEAMIKAIQGDAQTATWVPTTATLGESGTVVASPGQKGAIPTLAAIKQEMSRLEGEIASRKEQVAKLTAERQASLAEAEKKLSESAKAKGQQSVDLYKEGAAARQKSDEAAMQMDLVQVQLSRDEADLAVAKGQEASVNAAIAQMQEQLASLQEGWKSTQGSIASQGDIAGSIFKGGQDLTLSIDTTVTDIAKNQRLGAEERSKTLDKLRAAVEFYKKAASEAAKVGTDKRLTTVQPPGNKPYKDLKLSVHASRFNLPLGDVQRSIGTLSAEKAALDLEVERVAADLRKELAAINLTVPSDLPSISMDEIKNSLEAAQAGFEESAETLTSVRSGDTPDDVNAGAMKSHLITFYQRIELEGIKQKLDMSGTQEAIAKLNQDAEALRAEIVEKGLAVPRLPGPLGKPPTPASSTPAPPSGPASPEGTDVEPSGGTTPVPAPTGPFGAPSPDNTNPEPTTPPAGNGFGGGG